MIQKLEEGDYDLVAGIRKNRKDNFIRKLPSKIANAIIRRSTGVSIKDNGCALKVFRSKIVKNIGLYGELHRFISVLAALDGARIGQMEVRHHPRIHGQSKYGLKRTFKVVSDLILMVFFKEYMQKPMHLFGTTGIIITGIGVLINLYMLILKIMGQDIWGKPLLLLGILLLLAGFQIITVGIIAEFLMRTYYESQKRNPIKSDMSQPSKIRPILKTFVKILVAAAALWLVFQSIDISEVLALGTQIHPVSSAEPSCYSFSPKQQQP